MIPPSEINRFLSRQLDDHSWVKGLPVAKLDTALAELTPKPNVSNFNKAQKVGFLLGVAFPEFFEILDMGCVDCDTEFLSPTGWVRIADYKSGPVAQYEPVTGTARFVEPVRYIVAPCKQMFRFRTSRGGVDQKLSAEHRVLFADYKGNPRVLTAEEIASRQERLAIGWEGRFYTAFNIKVTNALPLTNEQLRVQVAVIADGHFPNANRRCVMRLKKERKRVRLRRLLNAAGIEFREVDCLPDGFRLFSFQAPRRDKVFDTFYWSASQEQLNIVADEVRYWDGSVSNRKQSIGFFSREKLSADFVQYAFCATGATARLAESVREDGSIDYIVTSRERHSLLWLRGITDDGQKTKPITEEPTVDGRKYCFQVPSGFLVFRRNGCVFLSGNCGKTLLAIRLLEYHYMTRQIDGISFVLVPNDASVWNWEDELNKWAPDLPYALLLGSFEQKWQTLERMKTGVVVVTYPGYASMVSELRQVSAGKRQGKCKRYPAPQLLDAVASRCDALILDESTHCGNVQSLTYNTVKSLSFAAKVRYSLAGRPFGRDPTMLWPQCFLTDHGASMSSSYSLFREAFFTKKKMYWGGPNSFEWKLNKAREPDMARALGHRSLQYRIEDVVDLPERVQSIRKVAFPEDAEAYYKKIIETLVKSRGNYREVESAFIKMRQIASGFLGFVDDETGEKAQVEFPDNPKLDELMALLEQQPDGKKAIVVHEYTWTGARICRELAARKIKHGWLWGGSKDWPQTKQRFETDPDFRVLVLSHKKGAFSLNLQRANYGYVVESPVSPIAREQVERRIWRQGQTQQVMWYDIVVRGSVDERILAFLREGGDLFKALVTDPVKTLAL